MSRPIVEIRNAGFQYEGADKPSLCRVSMQMRPGECVVLTGASGCGKTTLTRLANGLIPHFYEGRLEGEASVCGLDVAAVQPHELAGNVGSVFQNPRNQFFNTDTDSEIVFGMENAGTPRDEMRRRYMKTVQQLDIGRLCGRSVFELSGGEKQMVACAGVHAMQPDLLVLDEPSSNLDDAAIERLRKFLLLAKARGKTILIAEHRLYYLRDVADRVLLLEDGRITRQWPAREVAGLSAGDLAGFGLRSFRKVALQVPATAHNRTPPVLQVAGLSAGYKKGLPVLSDVTFKLATGTITGLVGQNGQGKSTLARVLCGLHKEWQGEVLFHGKRLRFKQRRQQVGLVMQDPNHQLFSDSVENELKLWARKAHIPSTAQIADVLQALELDGLQHRHPMALSGGQKQRLSIALAALGPARVLIFDEPTSGLDYANMQRVAQMLHMLADRGKAILVVSHDYEFLNTACDGFLCLRAGSIAHGLAHTNKEWKNRKGYVI